MQSLGLNRLAPEIASRPIGIALIAALLTAYSILLMVTQIKFTGDITENLGSDSQSYQDFKLLEENFHPFSHDENILIRTKDLSDPETYQNLQDFLLELQFANQVETAFSIFSLPDLSERDEASDAEPHFFLTAPEQSEKPEKERLNALRQSIPLASKMVSEDLTATIIVLMLAEPAEGEPLGLTAREPCRNSSACRPFRRQFHHFLCRHP